MYHLRKRFVHGWEFLCRTLLARRNMVALMRVMLRCGRMRGQCAFVVLMRALFSCASMHTSVEHNPEAHRTIGGNLHIRVIVFSFEWGSLCTSTTGPMSLCSRHHFRAY